MQRSQARRKLAISLRRQLRVVALAGLLALGWSAVTSALASPASALPLLGDGSDISSSDERRLGDRIARELYRDPDYLDDPVLSDYVQEIWQSLLAAARARGDLTPELDERFAWQVLLGRDRSVNAFALPGGYLGVHLGLLAVVTSRDELASVLGHELSHVTQRHISRLISNNNQQAPWVIGSMILGALAASKSAQTGNALIMGGQALSAQGQLNFSRDMEREADRVGFGIMTQAGFEAQGFVSMFDKLQQASRLNDSGAYPYLRSHPLTTERIADMQARIPLGQPPATSSGESVVHAMMAARARVLSQTGADALQGWLAQAREATPAVSAPAQRVGILYGAVMAASRLREAALAQRFLDQLRFVAGADAQAQRLVAWLNVEVALAASEPPRSSWQALGASVGLDLTQPDIPPSRRAELMLQAQLALRLPQAPTLAMVTQRLQTWVSSHPLDALAWQYLASLESARGQTLRALRAEAEAQAARLDYPAALDRLSAAQAWLRQPGNSNSPSAHIDASIVDTRYRQLEQLIKAQAQAQAPSR